MKWQEDEEEDVRN